MKVENNLFFSFLIYKT